MDAETITITIKGVPYYFNGDELTSPEHDAIEFLKAVREDNALYVERVSRWIT